MKFFEGCTALITGASAGLGAEFTRQLAPYARTVVLVARRQDRLEELRDELSTCFPNLQALIYRADLASESERLGLAQWLENERIDINFLINNAGLGDHGPFASSDYDRVRAMIETNITALTHLTHLLVPSMLRAGRAAILNVSSVAGFFPIPQMGVYAATKAYVTSFSEALRMELRPQGISVTALCPGPVPTEFFGVATRPGEEDRASHFQTMPAFGATAQEVAYTGLRAVAADRARIIPNPLLCLAVTAALLVPFCLVRMAISSRADKL
jgi:short-subunit dehydrogenase